MTDLKPCPFCGGKAYLANVAMAGCSYIVCTDCRVQTDDGSQDRVMTAWNTRAEPDPEALVKAALGHAAETSKEIADQYVGYMSRIETAIRALASDPDAVARIIKDAEKERG